MAQTPLRSIRVSVELWNAAIEKANREGTTVTQVIVDALRVFIGVTK